MLNALDESGVSPVPRQPPHSKTSRTFWRSSRTLSASAACARLEGMSPGLSGQVNVIANCLEIPRAAAVDEQRLATAAEHMSEELVPAIEPSRVSAQVTLHARDQARLRRLDNEM